MKDCLFMEENTVKILEYNTHHEKMTLPEYGRGVQKMVDHIKTIEDRAKRTEQAKAVVSVMEILNPAIHGQQNWEHTLWDHLFVIAGYDLDIDSPYPMPERKDIEARPAVVPIQKKPIKATHYGRNIESIIELIVEREDGEQKTAMIRDLAIYMRTQYLIWNKDTVSEETILNDIVKLSDGRITIPEGLTLGEISRQTSYNRPGMMNGGGQSSNRGKNGRHGNRRGGRK